MKTLLAITATLISSLNVTVQAQADAVSGSGHRLVVQCASALRYMDDPKIDPKMNFTAWEQAGFGYCLGLVRGVTETLIHLKQIDAPNATQGQGVRLVQKYLHDHPEELANPDVVLVFRALTEAFPRVKKNDNEGVK
jgi:hypothetical protein